MTAPVVPVEEPNVYAKFMDQSHSLIREGHLGIHNIKVMMKEHYQMIKKYDKDLYPVVLAVGAVAMLCINALLTTVFFAGGALYAVWKGDQWKDGIVKPLKKWWDDSNLSKISLIAVLILFAAPLKWNLAAFGLGIYAVRMIKEHKKEKALEKA